MTDISLLHEHIIGVQKVWIKIDKEDLSCISSLTDMMKGYSILTATSTSLQWDNHHYPPIGIIFNFIDKLNTLLDPTEYIDRVSDPEVPDLKKVVLSRDFPSNTDWKMIIWTD